MSIAIYCMLGLLTFLPAYGVGYIINTLCKVWQVSIILYVVGVIIVLFLPSVSRIDWILLGVMGVGTILSSWTVRSFQRGTYKKFLQPSTKGQ